MLKKLKILRKVQLKISMLKKQLRVCSLLSILILEQTSTCEKSKIACGGQGGGSTEIFVRMKNIRN